MQLTRRRGLHTSLSLLETSERLSEPVDNVTVDEEYNSLRFFAAAQLVAESILTHMAKYPVFKTILEAVVLALTSVLLVSNCILTR